MIPNNHAPTPWVESAGQVEHLAFPFEPGRVYRFKGQASTPDAKGNRRWVFPPGMYRLIGSGANVRTYQETVAVVGEADGRMWFFPLSDFAENFELMEVAT